MVVKIKHFICIFLFFAYLRPLNTGYVMISGSCIFKIQKNSTKAYQRENITPKVLTDNSDISTVVLCSDLNKMYF